MGIFGCTCKNEQGEAITKAIFQSPSALATAILQAMGQYLADIEAAEFESVEEKYLEAVALCAANKIAADSLRLVYPGSEKLWGEMGAVMAHAVVSAKALLFMQAESGE